MIQSDCEFVHETAETERDLDLDPQVGEAHATDDDDATEASPASAPLHERGLTDRELESELYRAIVDNELEYAEWLLQEGVPATSQDDRGVPVLHAAARGGHARLAQLLLDRGADIEATVWPDATPLHWAVRGGDVETISVLLENGANVHAKAGYSAPTPLAIAQTVKNEQVINLLLQYGAQEEH